MLRKIVILALLVLGAFLFYKKFMAQTLEPFFKEKSGKVDLLGVNVRDLE